MEPVALWKRAPVAFAIALLLGGTAAGFAVGYKVGDNAGKSTVKVAKPGGSSAGQKRTAAQVKFNQLLACMAGHGVKWPKTASRPNIGKLPPGVTQEKYKRALGACYLATPKHPRTKTTVRAAGP
jgi:hypothetical protein